MAKCTAPLRVFPTGTCSELESHDAKSRAMAMLYTEIGIGHAAWSRIAHLLSGFDRVHVKGQSHTRFFTAVDNGTDENCCQ